MITPVIDHQAIGLIVGGGITHPYFNHGGANAGYRCMLFAYQNGDGAVVMTNSDNGGPLIDQIVRTIASVYKWPNYAPPERVVADVDPGVFDRYVGAYRTGAGNIVTFWRDGNHFRTRISEQPSVEVYPESNHELFATGVNARWDFAINADTNESTTTLYQHDRRQVATRIKGPEGMVALDLSMTAEERFERQTPAPGAETALRDLIAGISSGNPQYEHMTSDFRDIVRRGLPNSHSKLAPMGQVVSVLFERVTTAAADVYTVQFEHGMLEFRIVLDSMGLVRSARWFD